MASVVIFLKALEGSIFVKSILIEFGFLLAEKSVIGFHVKQ
jgi:hypothetical protein